MPTEADHRRYLAHYPIAGIGQAGQARIGQAHVVLIGAGGLGCAVAQYLASSGIGRLTLCDFDVVAESNLARQVLYRQEDIGRKKVEVASTVLKAINPALELTTIDHRVSDAELLELLPNANFAIDASDNFGTRLAVNRSCLTTRTPWLMASCIRMEAQIMLMRPDKDEQPCYRCAYGIAPDQLEDCPGAGIFAPVAGIAGTTAAHFALATIAGLVLPAGLHLLDAKHWNWQHLKIPRNPDCQDCGPHKPLCHSEPVFPNTM